MQTTLCNANIVTPEGVINGCITFEDGIITEITENHINGIDMQGAIVMPGVIDTHVHFREPGMTHKATIHSESRAAAAGGVTSVLEMPNCNPTTTTIEALEQKNEIISHDSIIHCSPFIGATYDNLDLLPQLDFSTIPGIKVFMGSSTGGMLLEDDGILSQVFAFSQDIPVVTHCERTDLINQQAKIYGDSSDFSNHPLIRSRQACIESTRQAITLAQKYGTRLHVAHLSTAEEIKMISDAGSNITAEICVPHLLFDDSMYASHGSRIKCNPAIKTLADRNALRNSLIDGTAYSIATDHAPHLLSEKQKGGCISSPSGMPMVQFSLVTMLTLADEIGLDLVRLSTLMSSNPAHLFGISKRGELRPGYHADLAIVSKCENYKISDADVISKCAWTPLDGHSLSYRVYATYVDGRLVWDGKQIVDNTPASRLHFKKA